MQRTGALFVLAVLQQACIAHGFAGVGKDDSGLEQANVAPEERDALLSCEGAPCSSVPIERTYRRGRSDGVFWPVVVSETVLGFAGSMYFLTSAVTAPTSSGGTAGAGAELGRMLLNTFLAMACLAPPAFDAFAKFSSSEYGRQYQPWRLQKPVLADYRGMRVPLQTNDVVPFGAKQPPSSFSLAALLSRSGTSSATATSRAPAGARLTHGKVAVLDLMTNANAVSASDVRYFADVVRGATLKAQPQLELMTRENLLVLLQAGGKDLAGCEGDCEVETGRRIGADAIVSGEVLKVGSRFKLTLRLHETHDGKLLGAAVASGHTLEELDDAVSKAVSELFGSGP